MLTTQHHTQLKTAISSVLVQHSHMTLENYSKHVPEDDAVAVFADDVLACARPILGANFIPMIREYVTPEEFAHELYGMLVGEDDE